MSAALLAAVLAAAGVYLVLQKGLVRVTFGFVLLGHAANVVLVAAGGMDRRDLPILVDRSIEDVADPLPQAFALTAIVITFGITVYLLAMAGNGGEQDAPPAEVEPSNKGASGSGGLDGASGSGGLDGAPDDGAGTRRRPSTAGPIGTTATGAEPTPPTTGEEHA